MKSQLLPTHASRWLATRGPLILCWFTWGIVLTATAWMVASDRPAQDLLPFQTASALIADGRFDAVYPPEDAISLFDVHPDFQHTALRIAGEGYAREAVTAYVAPPPALLIGETLPADPTCSVKLWRLIIASVGLLSLLALETNLRRTCPDALPAWHLMIAGALPLLLYAVYLGQTSALLLAAVTATVLAPGKRRDILGGTALGLVAIAKLFPLAIIPAALWLRERRIAAVSLITVLAACALAIACWPVSLWCDFSGAAHQVSRHVIADWNNASIDAGLTALAVGEVSSTFRPPPLWVSIAATLVRVGLAGGAILLVIRERALPSQSRWTLLWIALLAATPLLWSHYLICLLPVLQPMLRRGARVVPVLLALGLSIGFLAKGHVPLWMVSALTPSIWLGAAGYIIVSLWRASGSETLIR